MHISEFTLDARANAYIKTELSFGHQLSKLIARELDLAGGLVTTLLPEGYEGDLYDFKSGGKFAKPVAEPVRIRGGVMVPVSNSQEHLVREINSLRTKIGRTGLVFEDYYARRDDPWLKRSRLNTAMLGDNVYHTISPTDPIELVAETLRRISAPPYSLAVFSRFLPKKLSAGCAEWSSQDMDMIARDACGLIFGVYDGESYLLWRPV
jgi:hypothetical protein